MLIRPIKVTLDIFPGDHITVILKNFISYDKCQVPS